MDIAMRDLIQIAENDRPRMFVVAMGLNFTARRISRGSIRRRAESPMACPEVLPRCGQPVARGRGLIKMYASTGTDDMNRFSDYNYENQNGRGCRAQVRKENRNSSYGPMERGTAVRAGTDSLEHATDMASPIQEMASAERFMSQPLITTAITWQLAEDGYANVLGKTKAFIERNLETARKAFKAA